MRSPPRSPPGAGGGLAPSVPKLAHTVAKHRQTEGARIARAPAAIVSSATPSANIAQHSDSRRTVQESAALPAELPGRINQDKNLANRPESVGGAALWRAEDLPGLFNGMTQPAIPPWQRPSVWTLVIANLLPVFGLLLPGWDIFEIMFLYWMESVLIGVFNVGRMMVAERDQVGWIIKLVLISCFAALYGFLTLALGGALLGLFGEASLRPGASTGNLTWQEIGGLFHHRSLWLGVAGLAGSHAYSFVTNYLRGGEYRRVSPIDLILRPFGRVLFMQVAVFVGAWLFLELRKPPAFFLPVILLKILLDAIAHIRERVRLAEPRPAGPAASLDRSAPAHPPPDARPSPLSTQAVNRERAPGAMPATILGRVFIAMGLVCFAAMLYSGVVFTFVPELRYCVRSARWPTADGVIVTSTVERGPLAGGSRPARPVIRYEYTLPDGQKLSGIRVVFGAPVRTKFSTGRSAAIDAQREVAPYPLGRRVRVAYDPADPSNAVLEPGLSFQLFISALTIVFASLFGAGLIWIGRLVIRSASRLRSPVPEA